MVLCDGQIRLQAGGGIVHDSEPSDEYAECLAKLGSGARALGVTMEGARAMICVIDNYDSFVYNLVQYVGDLGAECVVYRNDEVTIEQVADARARLGPHLAGAR